MEDCKAGPGCVVIILFFLVCWLLFSGTDPCAGQSYGSVGGAYGDVVCR